MRQLVILLSFFTLFAILGCGHSGLRSIASVEGRIYSLRGLHPSLGAYQGELEVRFEGERQLITRVVTYDQFRFEGQQVQEIWQGEGKLSNSVLTTKFKLKQADIFSKVDGYLRSHEDFVHPLIVSYTANFARGLANIETIDGIFYDQILSEDTRAPEAKPLWQDERQKIASKSEAHNFMAPKSTNKNFLRALQELQNDDFAKKYKDRSEFKNKTQYFIFDPTDFEFLRTHPNTLRVANKKLDMISLVEATLRRDAYAPSLNEKVKRFDADTEENYLNELGLYAGAHFDLNGRHAGYLPNNDALLWTGLYAGAQAMRWKVTHDNEALVQFKKSIRGLLLALDISEAGELVRTVHLLKENETANSPWHQGAGEFKKFKYLEGADRSLFLGLLYGLVWSYEILPAQDPVLAEVSQRAAKLSGLKMMSDEPFRFVGKGFIALATNSENAHQEYLRAFQKRKIIVPSEGDWVGANLRSLSESMKIIMAQNILKKYKTPKEDRKVLAELRQNLLKTWTTYASSRRGLITVAANTFAVANDSVELDPETAAKKWNHHDVWASDLQQAVWLMREVPLIQHPHSLHYDFTMRPDWSLSGWSLLPPRYWEKDTDLSRFYQGAYDFPIFESKANGTDNYWASAFGYRGGASAQNRFGRVDYLHMYWMSRFSGIIGPAE